MRVSFLLLIFFIFSGLLHAEHERCYRNDFDPDKTFLTFYGDSLGDFVDENLYGFFGWETYLKFHNSSVEWNVQNLAVAGYTTRGVYDFIQECSTKDELGKNFRTADHVAIEIGGNDFKDNLSLLIWMPWKYNDVQRRVTLNTRILVRMLRNPLRNKKVLVMGNFPVISNSPILGNFKNYFKYFRQPLNNANLRKEEAKEKIGQIKIYRNNHRMEYNGFKTWLSFAGENITTLLSVSMMTHQSSLEEMVSQENNYDATYVYRKAGHTDVVLQHQKGGVFFLPLYEQFSHYPDAAEGRAYIANPDLYADYIHINYLGYFLWSSNLAFKITSLGWHNMSPPAMYDGKSCRAWNCGLIKSPPLGSEIKEDALVKPPVVTVDPDPLDWAILFCLITKKCRRR